MIRPVRFAVPFALAFASALSACGGNDDGDEPGTTPAASPAATSATGGTTTLFDEAKATTSSTGLKYIDEVAGTGKQPTPASSVLVHYRGQLTDGTEFDSSYGRGAPTSFALSDVIPGFSEGILGMKEGGKRVIYIPWALGYGEGGYPGVIPPRADLVFTVELIEVR